MYFMVIAPSVYFSICEQRHVLQGENEPSTWLSKSHTLRSNSSEGDKRFL